MSRRGQDDLTNRGCHDRRLTLPPYVGTPDIEMSFLACPSILAWPTRLQHVASSAPGPHAPVSGWESSKELLLDVLSF